MTLGRKTLFMILIMTVMMGLILSAVFTWQATGFGADFLQAWADRFVSTYVIVLPTVLIVSPIAQALATRLDATFATASGPSPASPRDIVLAAWKANGAGHNGASFEPWFERLRDDVSITMPLGQFRGENKGMAVAHQIYGAIAAANPRLTYEDPIRISENGNTVVLEFDDHGTIAGYPYKNRIAASFDVVDGKIAAYREYFGDIDPAVVALMTSPANDTSAAAR
jgi:ketosteroid isomerase-like protein